MFHNNLIQFWIQYSNPLLFWLQSGNFLIILLQSLSILNTIQHFSLVLTTIQQSSSILNNTIIISNFNYNSASPCWTKIQQSLSNLTTIKAIIFCIEVCCNIPPDESCCSSMLSHVVPKRSPLLFTSFHLFSCVRIS